MKSRDVSRGRGWIRKALVSVAAATAGVAALGLVSSPTDAAPKPAVEAESGAVQVKSGISIKLPPGGGYTPQAGIRW